MSNGIEAKDILAVIVAIISSGMVQYLLTRHDNKKNIKGEIEKKMDEGFKEVKTEIKAEIQDVRAEIKDVRSDVKDVRGDVKEVSERLEEHKATLARTHILRFADELRTGTHSKEYFEQQLQDIDTYNNYCSTHPKFVNEMAKMAIRIIRKRYEDTYDDGTD